MFKKRERKGRNHCTRKKRDEDDGSNDESDTISSNDPSGAAQSDDALQLQSIIAKTKQRRTLIHQLQSKRGVDALELLQQSSKSISSMDNSKLNENIDDTINRTNMSSRVDALSSKTQLPTGGTIVAEEQMIWDQKHAAAMEEYVQQQLLLKSSLPSNHTVTTIHETEEPQSTTDATAASTTIKSLGTSKEQLYRELAAQAAKLSGTEPNTGVHPRSTPGLHHDDSTTTSGDVVTAGAATAIVEVILPLDDRLQAVMATAHCAAHQHPPTNHPRTTMTAGRSSSSSAVPNRFRSSYNHHHPMGNSTSNHVVRKRPLSNDHHGVDVTTESSSLTSERPGFAAARLLQQQQQNRSVPNRTGKNPNQNSQYSRSTDDRVYQQFIKRQREQHGR